MFINNNKSYNNTAMKYGTPYIYITYPGRDLQLQSLLYAMTIRFTMTLQDRNIQ